MNAVGERTRATVVAREVRKSFSAGRGSRRRVVDVLRGVSLRVEPGEMVGIVGPSGSGKSTLLYCLSGLESADAGSIEVMGRQVVRASRTALFKTRRDHVGFIFQSYNLVPSLSAGENVSLPARLAGRPLTTEQTAAVLASVGLLRGIAVDPQRSVVMVTHDLEAASLADRVLVLKDGQVLRELGRSAPAEILEALEAAR